MRTPPTKLATLLGATLLLAGLTACSADPEPIIDPSPPTTSPPASPTPTATLTPPEPEQESARAFIRRWQDEAFAMQLSGDTSRYRAMSIDCESCDNLAATVDEIYEAGGSVDTRPGRVQNLKKVGTKGQVRIYEYKLRSYPSTVIRMKSGKPEQLSGGVLRYQVNILERAQGLRIVSATGLAS